MENYQELPQVSFGQAVKQGFRKILSFKGRSRRSEFWWFILALYLIVMVLSFAYDLLLPVLASTIVGICISALYIPAMARRLHDRNHCAALPILQWLLNGAFNLYLIFSGYIEELQSVNFSEKTIERLVSDPIVISLSIGSVVVSFVLLVLLCLDGKKEPNRYGPSPKYIEKVIVNTEETIA